jgi:hypothetical protein
MDTNSDPVSVTVGSGDTCGGAISGNTYTFTPGEAMGGTSCVVDVACSDTQASATQTQTVDIAEVNGAPVITNTDLTSSAHWSGEAAVSTRYKRHRLPAQLITWSIASHTCTGLYRHR